MPAGINQVYEENTFTSASANFTGPGSLTVEEGAFIMVGTGDNALEMLQGPWKVKVDGAVESGLNGIVFYNTGITTPLKNSALTVGAEGTILGSGSKYSGLSSNQAMDVTNSGVIQGGNIGIGFANFAPSSSKVVTITNNATGVITGGYAGIFDNDESHSLIVKNAGNIDGVSWIGEAKITNSGSINILEHLNSTMQHDDTITNSGTANSVHLLTGDDTVKNTGQISTFVNLGNGNNSFVNSGFIGTDVASGIGDDAIMNSGSITGDVHLGDGSNKLTNSGTIDGLIFGGGNDDLFKNSGVATSFRLGCGSRHVDRGKPIGARDRFGGRGHL